MSGNAGDERVKKAVDGGDIVGLHAAQTDAVIFEKPPGQPAELPLGADVGAGAHDGIKPKLRSRRKEILDIQHIRVVEFALPRLVHIPCDIGLDGVEAAGLELDEAVAPVFAGHSEIVDSARYNSERLAAEAEAVLFDSESFHIDLRSVITRPNHRPAHRGIR